MKDTVQVSIHLPAELLRRVDESAKANRRSRTGEICVRLEAGFEGEENE